jgi:mRNA-degrading endonuclease RelE of RelBE toxin-antitoxin system
LSIASISASTRSDGSGGGDCIADDSQVDRELEIIESEPLEEDSLELHLSLDASAEGCVAFGMSPQFKKEILSVEKNLKGRILDALSQVLESPRTIRGDTVKPLSGAFRGLWRLRIGDYRLIYQPSADGRMVMLVSFAGRGSVYTD